MLINSNMYEYLRRARSYALIGEMDSAFENLSKTAEQGFTSKQEMENDAELVSLISDIRWEVLIEKPK